MTFWFGVLLRCLTVCLSRPPALLAPVIQYSMFVLKVPLNTNQQTNLWQTRPGWSNV